MAGSAMTAKTSLHTVGDEVRGVLAAVSSDQMAEAAQLLEDRARRWFCCGQGRSGLVAQMAAMRLMHVGYDVHAIGEPTTPSIAQDDGLLAISGSGETPVTLHFARLAHDLGTKILTVTGKADSTLANLAQTRIELPTAGTGQFGGTLFEQTTLLVLDALVLDITAGDAETYASMQSRHANLQ
jgi:6-phospho-3-hexuloisomerase